MRRNCASAELSCWRRTCGNCAWKGLTALVLTGEGLTGGLSKGWEQSWRAMPSREGLVVTSTSVWEVVVG